MLNSLPVRLLWRSLNHLTRLTVTSAAIIALLCAATIIAMRYWVLPDIEQYHERITRSLSQAMGNPISIGKIEGDWNGLYPHLKLTDVRLLDQQQQTALALPYIDAKVSWLSLLAAELRLSSLVIDRPSLVIRRDKSGKTFIGNVALTSQGTDNDLANWLLHQSHMVVRNAVIVWLDEQRDAPPLALNQVNLRIENLFRHHQFALRAVPPAELSTPLDVRGDFRGRSFDNLKEWRGQIYTQLDHTDLLGWRPWLNLPEQLSSGRGAIRGWLSVADGGISQFTADLSLRDLSTRLADNVPTMNVDFLLGRAAWQTVENGWEVSTRHLSMRLENGLRLRPTDFHFRSIPANAEHPASGELRANLLQLESLVSLANFLPMDAQQRARLDAYGPRGRVSDLELQWEGVPKFQGEAQVPKFKIKGVFDNLSLQPVNGMPGFSGLSASVDGSDSGGNLGIKSRDLMLDSNGAMREPLFFKHLTGQLNWQREGREWVVKLESVSVANDDLAGNLYGSYQTKAGTPGVLDLTVSLTRGDLRRAARYTPLVALEKKDNDWLNDAMLSGHTENFHLRIKGNLSDFPLDGTKDAMFEVTAHCEDATVAYAPDWPTITNISGEFSIHGNKLEARVSKAAILGANIHDLTIALPDMASPDIPLEIKGQAEAGNAIHLDFIQKSPVRGYIKGFTDNMTATGNGHLELYARIPLRGTKPVTVSGSLLVQNADLDMGGNVPMLRNTNGTLAFTESGMNASDVTANILGGPARLNIQTAEGGVVNANVHGRANLDELRKVQSAPLLASLRGATNWDAAISMVNKTAQVTLNSNLQGIVSTLPAPLTKRANETWPLRFEKKSQDDIQDEITFQIGKVLKARLQRSEENGISVVKRGTIVLGTPVATDAAAGKKPADPKSGVWISGRLPALSLQGWGGLFSGPSGATLPISGGNLQVDKLSGYGMAMKDIQIGFAKRGDGVAAQLSGAALNGELVWQPQGFEGTGKLTAHLHNLYWLSDDQNKAGSKPTSAQDVEVTPTHSPHDLPALELSVDDFQYKNKQIGRFELVGHPDGKDWRLRRFRITNPDGSLSGDGAWHEGRQTDINLTLEISNAGKILARSGYPDTVKNGSGKLIANLSWAGHPDEFSYATLNGTLKLDTGKGQFLKMDPGMGKLLSILSLQSLPKRITLDFNDIFSEGFEFDNINGNATIKQGLMLTQDLHIEGSSAKVTMQGNVNLNNETQDLRVTILPTLGDSVSVLSAFAAGPVVGIGTLIVNKVLGNPLDKLVSFEYNISGTWSNPNVVKLGEKPVTGLTPPAEKSKKSK
ncbi:MAG: YhdP family protein [Gallionella sp.]|nr:YhdP family protein [Gallionella sp.]